MPSSSRTRCALANRGLPMAKRAGANRSDARVTNPMTICFLIGSAAADSGSAAARLARLRGARLVHCQDFDVLPGQVPQRSMIAIGASRMRELSGRQRRHLANLVGEGATLYVRGVAQSSATLDLRPFASVELAIAPERNAVGYRFTASPMLP